MICPGCKKGALRFERLEEKLPASRCTECGGVWINDANYWKWQAYHGSILPEKPFEETAPLQVVEREGIKVCPECSHFLTRRRVGHGIQFHVDRCATCGGIWLDRNEWEVLKSRNLHDEIHLIFSEEWQRAVRNEESETVLADETLHRIGFDNYKYVCEFKRWLDSCNEKSFVMALLGKQ